MKKGKLFFSFVCILFLSNVCNAQDSPTFKNLFPSGIGVSGYTGYLAVRDEHISDERYTGWTSGFDAEWSHYHETYGFRLGISYLSGSEIKNYNVSAKIQIFKLGFSDMYPAGGFFVFGKKTFVSFGPGMEMMMYDRRQNIAQNLNGGVDIYRSLAWLFSLSGRAEAIMQISKSFQADGAVQLSLLSFGGGAGNSLNSSTTVRFLTVFAGMYGKTDISLRYYLIKNISLRAGYAFELLRLDSWNYILAGIDNIYLSLKYCF